MTPDNQKVNIFARLDTDLLRETSKTNRAMVPEKKQADEAKEKNTPTRPERPNSTTSVDPIARSTERPNGPLREQVPLRRRGVRRASYELFTDQIDEIRRLSLEISFQGGKGNQSELVREALDKYLEQKRKTK